MAKKMSANDAAMQQKMRVLTKLRDNCIKNEKDLQQFRSEYGITGNIEVIY